jgi:hypothetical protein
MTVITPQESRVWRTTRESPCIKAHPLLSLLFDLVDLDWFVVVWGGLGWLSLT